MIILRGEVYFRFSILDFVLRSTDDGVIQKLKSKIQNNLATLRHTNP